MLYFKRIRKTFWMILYNETQISESYYLGNSSYSIPVYFQQKLN